MINHTNEIIKSLIQAEESSFKYKAMQFCNQIGLMQFRIVRYLFSIDDNRIEVVARTALDQPKQAALIQLCQKWHMNIPTNAIRIERVANKSMDPKVKAPALKTVSLDDPEVYKRTVLMDRNLRSFEEYNPKEKQLTINGTTYQVVSSEISNFANHDLPFVSCGSGSGREMILFDPKNSPRLQNAYREFETHIQKYGRPLQPEEIFAILTKHMHKLFKKTDDDTFDNLIKRYASMPNRVKTNKSPCISIEVFLKEEYGVCRHHSLVAAYFMDRLMTSKPELCAVTGKMQIMRSDVKGGAHAWLTFATDDKRIYCVDTLNNFAGNLNNLEHRQTIERIFGRTAVKNQLIKADKISS